MNASTIVNEICIKLNILVLANSSLFAVNLFTLTRVGLLQYNTLDSAPIFTRF